MDKTILLQKQIRDNSEDLQREFLDVKAWEEQMKKKDLEIRNSKDDRVLPPVRTKKKKKSAPSAESGSSQESKPTKAKRIAGHDYSAWDKFDANKACKEVEGKKEEEEKVFEIPSKEELEKEHEEANKFKDEGNALVKKQEYAKAVSKYSQAIKIFPYDAVFYANRALCHLKLDNLYSAESDCTDAIKRDEHYVKAYHRRATVRMEFKRYRDALKDIEMVLKLDPSNKEATSMLAQAQKKLENSKPLIISTTDKNEKSSIEKTIGEKLFANSGKGSSKEKISKSVEGGKTKKVKIEELQPSTSKDNKTVPPTVEEKEKNTCERIKTSVKQNTCKDDKSNKETEDLPAWLPELKEGVCIVKPLAEAPRRLNKALKRVDIKEISPHESIFKDVERIDRSITKTPEEISEVKCITKTDSKINNEISNQISNKNDEAEETFPPAPKSSVAFLLNWRKYVSPDFRYKYLKQIRPEDFPGIFKESMESNIFSDILSTLSTQFVINEDKIYDYLFYLAKVKRFRALLLFMTETDKAALKTLFEYCKTKEGKSEEEVKSLISAYEM